MVIKQQLQVNNIALKEGGGLHIQKKNLKEAFHS